MSFADVKKNFGFGCMRLPMQGEEVDLAQFSQMVDEYLAAGFNCFDTARVYLGGKSEPACPQHLPIRQYLKDAAKEFEKK